MNFEMYINKTTAEFRVDEYETTEDGQQVPIPGEAVYLVEFEPALLTQEEYFTLLKKTKKHAVKVSI